MEKATVKETILFPQDQLFYPPMASLKEPRTHVTYLRLNLPGVNIRSPYAGKRAIQIFGEYYYGNLPFGQFYKLREAYYGAGINVSF